MKCASLIGKINTGYHENWVGAGDAFSMATKGGAACFNSQEIGELKIGAKADFSIFNLEALTFFPHHNRLYQLVYSENSSSLEMVVVDGKILMEHGKVTIIDETSLMNRLLERQDRILSMIAESSGRSEELKEYVQQAYKLCLKLSEVSSLERT
jgi:cytosine/adenosine deaminase-related metal-dependent hydrolase